MRFFRKSNNETEPERCPYCREPLPEGATECLMCGSRLPAPATPQRDEREAAGATRARPTRP